jgi:hypothetical protein
MTEGERLSIEGSCQQAEFFRCPQVLKLRTLSDLLNQAYGPTPAEIVN